MKGSRSLRTFAGRVYPSVTRSKTALARAVCLCKRFGDHSDIGAWPGTWSRAREHSLI